jgi:hypothetical protein
MAMLLEFSLGVLAGLIAWLIVVAILRPHLTFEDKLRTFDSGTPDGEWQYVSLRNRQPWSAIDVAVSARLRVRGLYSASTDRWATFELPLDDEHVPYLPGTLRSNRKNASRIKTIVTGATRQSFRVYLPAIPERLRAFIAPDIAPEQLTIHDLLNLGAAAEIYFVAFATDGFSGTRAVFKSPAFRIADL